MQMTYPSDTTSQGAVIIPFPLQRRQPASITPYPDEGHFAFMERQTAQRLDAIREMWVKALAENGGRWP